jgi:hypothetical protein
MPLSPSNDDCAYAAALFDTCIIDIVPVKFGELRLLCESGDPAIAKFMGEEFGGRTFEQGGDLKWEAVGNRALEVLGRLLPYLRVRRGEVRQILNSYMNAREPVQTPPHRSLPTPDPVARRKFRRPLRQPVR